MLRPSPLPASGGVFLDPRGAGKSLRVSRHPEAGVVVLSLWRGEECTGSFRLPQEQVADLVAVLNGEPPGASRLR